MSTSRTVSGEIRLPDTGVPEQTAAVVVQVEDVSRADAPSVIGGEQRHNVKLRSGGVLPLHVEVLVDRIDERSYSVQVHVDVSGSGEVSVGDLISTRSYPVLTRGHPDHASIKVQPV